MPPKAPPSTRGRGGARGRGRGRGGSAAARPAADAPPSQSGDAQAEAAASSDSAVVPKQEEGADSAVAESDVSATVETPHASAAEPLSIASTPAPDRSARPPRERLASLKSTEPSSRSASPAVRRGAPTRGKKSVLLPTNAGRRSKEERDARNAADLQRERERNKERDAVAARKQRQVEAEERRAQQRAAGRGRGGHSGQSSFFGGVKPDKRAAYRSSGFGGGGGGGSGSGSGSRAARVKDEDDDAGPGIKREHGGHISSDDDDEDTAEFRRKDIDYIELSSDEGEAPRVASPRPHAHLPIRIHRKEHVERKFGINTDSSTQAPASATQQVEASSSSTAEISHKGKGKAKDVEITGERKPYKGMWQDSDGPDDVKVKAEPSSEDEEAENREQVGIGAASTKAERSPERERRSKLLSKDEPSFQTEEERDEWNRIQFNLAGMRKELGPPDQENSTEDASGDIGMVDAGADGGKPNVRDDHTYLFQLPPIMPELLLPGIKKEPSDAQPSLAEAATAKGQPVIKKEEEFSDAQANVGKGARFASGHVGKLRVHRSGRTTLDWGGTSYELGAGNPASFLQEVVSLQIIPEGKRVVPEDAGEAYSYGGIKEKFVVTPNFSQLLG
ncbi:hypothetical protein N0V90_010547 [Kalmusia sp. IMI 367209]|nr:hypothetical protein N0V90_010547 [Kalmusia sp. IMI 367209]